MRQGASSFWLEMSDKMDGFAEIGFLEKNEYDGNFSVFSSKNLGSSDARALSTRHRLSVEALTGLWTYFLGENGDLEKFKLDLPKVFTVVIGKSLQVSERLKIVDTYELIGSQYFPTDSRHMESSRLFQACCNLMKMKNNPRLQSYIGVFGQRDTSGLEHLPVLYPNTVFQYLSIWIKSELCGEISPKSCCQKGVKVSNIGIFELL